MESEMSLYVPSRPEQNCTYTLSHKMKGAAPGYYISKPLFAGAVLLACWLCRTTAWATDEKSIQGFKEAIIKLSPTVDSAEAEAVAVTSHRMARQLSHEYRVVGPAVFQNFLINIGARQRGYCAHYARDIGTRLKELHLKTLYLHWGAADANTHLEHNVIVVTALNQPFHDGYIIDAWRNGGRLCWWPVLKDSSYVWKEDLQETAWLHDYEVVRPKATVEPQPLLESKAAAQAKRTVGPKAAVKPKATEPSKTEKATASLEIRG